MYSEARFKIENTLQTIPDQDVELKNNSEIQQFNLEKNIDIQHINLDDFSSLSAAASSIKEFDWIILTWLAKYHNVIDTYYEFLEFFKKKSQDSMILVIPCDCSEEFIKDFQEIKTKWIKSPSKGNYNFEAIAFEDTNINNFILKFYEQRVLYYGADIKSNFSEAQIKTFRVRTEGYNFWGMKKKEYKILVLIINFGIVLLDIHGNQEENLCISYYSHKKTNGGGRRVTLRHQNYIVVFEINKPVCIRFNKDILSTFKHQKSSTENEFILQYSNAELNVKCTPVSFIPLKI